MYERYATGKYTIDEILELAHVDGLAYRKSGASVPKSTAHKILRNRIYSGDFDFDGVTYARKYEAIVSRELWEQVQAVMAGRGARKTRKVKQDLAFSGLITCGHCGCALVGDIKKDRYRYYRCSHYKGACSEPYTREEVLEQKFTEMLKGITFSDDVLAWAADVMQDSHADERKGHEDAIARLQQEHQRVQGRIEAMYVDKLDGRIDGDFYDRKATEFRARQARLKSDIETHRTAMQTYAEQGARVRELAARAAELFEKQPAAEKRKLLDFVIAGCKWNGGELEPGFREPFGMLAA